jgi:outer membrane protein OmpA-like peptidoglycan-associated protein
VATFPSVKSTRFRLSALISLISLISTFVVITPSSAAACSPTETTDGLYTVLTFSTTGTCTWTVPTGITSLDSLVVAGGGGGGSGSITYAPDDGAGGGGGGGGQVIETTSRTVSATQVITIVVGSGGNGAGGNGRNYYGDYGYPGGTSSISLASGWSTSAVAGGGSLVDSSKYNLVAWGAGRNRTGTAVTGTPAVDLLLGGYGGGSGNGTVGANPSGKQAGQGASDNAGVTPAASTSVVTGVSSSITGTAVVYANGGGGGSQTVLGATGTTYGSGGGGGKSADVSSPNNAYPGTNGLSGVVIVRFLTYVAPSSSSSDDDSTPTPTPSAINPCSGSHKVTIYFGGGDSEIDNSDKKKINDLAKLINTCAFKKVVLSGFTSIDKPDTPSYALFRKSLSKKRANNVEEALVAKLSKKNKKLKFKTYAKSNANPKKSNKSEKTRSANRRVEIVVY